MFYDLLFPQMMKKFKWHEINANKMVQAALYCFDAPEDDKNRFLDQKYLGRWLKFIEMILEVDYTYGGYMEDRSALWSGHYMKPDEMIHLGVDYNVPAGTTVQLPFDAELVYCGNDGDQDGGWGGKMIFKPRSTHPANLANEPPYFIFGHLDQMAKKDYMVGKKYFCRGEVIGEVGHTDCNGGWYPHLHVQCVRDYNENVDGYGKLSDTLKEEFPNPELAITDCILFG